MMFISRAEHSCLTSSGDYQDHSWNDPAAAEGQSSQCAMGDGYLGYLGDVHGTMDIWGSPQDMVIPPCLLLLILGHTHFSSSLIYPPPSSEAPFAFIYCHCILCAACISFISCSFTATHSPHPDRSSSAQREWSSTSKLLGTAGSPSAADPKAWMSMRE